jgi:hypothetical protein
VIQSELVQPAGKSDHHFDIGKGYSLYLPRGPRRSGELYHEGCFIKRINFGDKAELRLAAVELLQKNLKQTRLAEVLMLSRQSLHNYRESYRAFGLTGLLHGYSPSHSKNAKLQARLHVEQRRPGGKALELRAMRRAQKQQTSGAAQNELAWDAVNAATYTLEEPVIDPVLHSAAPVADVITKADQPSTELTPHEQSTPVQALELPYAENHDWEASRYAGVFPVLMVLMSQWQWMQRLFRLFGNGWRIFQVFALMAVRNIRSLEQTKNIRHSEAGRLLGLGQLPGLETLWSWFHEVAQKRRAGTLLKGFFADQIRCGLVAGRLWFTDGHLLPYTGEQKVHAAWNTQRRMPMPGQTNLVTTDDQGRIVYFEIQEGHGDLRAQILKLGAYAREQGLGTAPINIFDREGTGTGFFSGLVQSRTPFITWEKNADIAQLMALPEQDFTRSLSMNGTQYRLLEQTKAYTYEPPADSGTQEPAHCFELGRVVMWNLRTNHRASVLCWDGELNLPAEDVLRGMLSRWGASENTFKQLKERHPYHYHPGFATSKSDKQDIANPQLKVLAQQISITQRQLTKLYKQHTKTKPRQNRDGSQRANSKHQQIADAIAQREAQLNRLKSEKAQLPERVDVAGLSDYRSFKAIDNEGKNLFDFVTASVWNARRQLLDWLHDSYAKDSDRVDLLYAIMNCHGWIRSDEQWVVVRLEPLQQPARRCAQEHLCRKLTGLGARIPGGKWLRVEVGETPI